MMIDIYQGGNSRVRYIQIDIWWLRLRKRSRLGPLSRLPRKSGVRRFKSLVSWDCRIFWRYITAAVIYTIQFETSSQCLRGVRYEACRHKEEAGNEPPSSPLDTSSLLEREMQEERTMHATIDKIIPRCIDRPRKFYQRPDYRISREGESIEYIREWNLLFFSFFSSSFPLPRRNWSKDSDPPSRGSPREIRSGRQSGLIKRY